MAQGLDELVEWLVGEVSFYGDGCLLSELLASIRRFQETDDGDGDGDGGADSKAISKNHGEQQSGQLATDNNTPPTEDELKLARLAWEWLMDTGEVSIGPNGEWNHLTFDDIWSLPEEVGGQGGTKIADSKPKDSAAPSSSKPKKKLPKIRPRLFVGEETVWKTLTGHGKDLKRVPNLEWKCLVAIGSTKETGIIQGDLVRQTGQDKRSVPKRTDFLAQKGYIAKRTHMVRGTKTSKLWLARFAPNLPVPSNPLGNKNLSRGSLTKDMEPVPWHGQWTGRDSLGRDQISYVALGQTIIAIIKAWGTLRIRDLKSKLGILGKKWHMKVMSRFLRRFNKLGNLTYVAARFVGEKHVFKDCIRFTRDPTEEDWRKLMATGKKTSNRTRDGRKPKSKKARGRPKKAVSHAKTVVRILKKKDRARPRPVVNGWVPEKPLANTLADYVLSGGTRGYSNAEVSTDTVGFAFRRLLLTYMNNMSNEDIQPPDLQEYQMRYDKVNLGGKYQLMYTVAGTQQDRPAGQPQEESAIDPALQGVGDSVEKQFRSQDMNVSLGFGSVDTEVFMGDGSSNLTVLSRKTPATQNQSEHRRARLGRPLKVRATEDRADSPEPTKQPNGERDDEPEATSPQPPKRGADPPPNPDITQDGGDVASDTPVARPSRKRKAAQRVSYLGPSEVDAEGSEPVDIGGDDGAPPKRKRTATIKDHFAEPLESENGADEESGEEQGQDRSKPGVYIGKPGSLAPDPYKKGRPRKSSVVIFRSDKIKNPNHLPGWADYPKPPAAGKSSRFASRPRKRQTRPLIANEAMQAGRDTPSRHEQAAAPAQVVVAGKGSDRVEAVGQQRQSMTEDAEVEEATIVVGGASGIDEDQEKQGELPIEAATDGAPTLPADSVTPVTTEPPASDAMPEVGIEQPKKRGRGPKKPKLDKYICEKCGGTWKNDIGLKYHLEKAKTACNPYYAEHPELMVKAKAVRTNSVLYGTPEPDDAGNAGGGGSQRGDSGSPRPRTPKLARVPRKKTNFAPRPVGPSDPANHRTVLKQRITLKNRHSGGLGLVAPRGVKVSEAVAKETVTPNPAESSTNEQSTPATAESTAVEAVAAGDRSAENMDAAELEEDLPYLAHIRSVAPKPQPQPMPSVFQVQDFGETGRAWQQVSGAGRESPRVPPSDGYSVPDTLGMDHAYPEPPASTYDVPVAFDPYPVEALNPSTQNTANRNMGSNDCADGVVFASSTAMATAGQVGVISRKPLPVQHNSSGSQNMHVESNHAAQKAIPQFRLPATDFTRWSENMMRRYRVIEIIRYLLTCNKGVFPGGRALFYAVLKMYAQEFTDSELPTAASMNRALKALQDEKVVKETSAAYRSDGHWSTLDMIMLTHINPNGEVAGELKRHMKDAQPELYIPPAFAPTASEEAEYVRLNKLPKARNKGPGRRDHKLAEDIGVLSAPLYVEKGMAGMRSRKRRVHSEDESNAEDGEAGDAEAPRTPRRRGRKRVTNGQSRGIGAAKKRKPGRSRKSVQYGDDEDPFLHAQQFLEANPGLKTLPQSFFSGTADPPASSSTATTELQFLAPNTRLEEEDEPEPEAEDADATPSHDPTQEYEEHFLRTEGEGPFARTIQIPATEKGAWPNMSISWFEANDCSFSMDGWFPDPKELLKQHLPKSMEQMAYKITSHCRTDKWADPAYGQFLTSVDGCMSWELSDQGQRYMSGSIVPDYLFICFSPGQEVSNMSSCEPQWHDDNHWTPETIPYSMLVYEEEEAAKSAETAELYGIIPNSERGIKRGPGRPRKHTRTARDCPPRRYVRKGQKDESIRELKLQRELTAYPREPHEYFRQKGEEDPEIDWKAEDTRIAAYVAVSTLLGGINKAMDWGVMMRIFPDSKLSNLRKFWATIKKEREGFIQNLTVKFQEDFLEAYENGDVPSIDFDKPLEYDWPRLVKWTLALVVREGIDLPPTHMQLNEDLELIPVEKGDFDWRDSFYHWQRSVFNKFQDATSEAAATILKSKNLVEDDTAITARSWVRALCCTEEQKYTPHSIKAKFLTLAQDGRRTEQEVSDLLENTIRDLEHRRIAIKQRSQALAMGRPYKLNEHFLRALDRYSNEVKFTVAADYKIKMDEAFRKGEAIEIPWRTEDGMVVAAFNMQAYGRVHIEPIKRLNIPFGFKPGFYESRKFPKSYYRFDLQITPTSRYLYNEEIEVLRRATAESAIPTAPEGEKIPMWCDFFGKPDRARWFKILSSVLFVLGTRGAMTDDFTAQALRPCVEIFEVEMVRKWALEQGIVNEITEGGGAVSVCEWWWLVCGLPVIEMKEAEAEEGARETAGRLTNDQYAGWHKRRWRGQYRVH